METRKWSRAMPVNIVRLERLALLLVLVSVGLVFKLVVLMRALRSAAKELAAVVPARPHAPPAA
jgi:hypothetical protein